MVSQGYTKRGMPLRVHMEYVLHIACSGRVCSCCPYKQGSPESWIYKARYAKGDTCVCAAYRLQRTERGGARGGGGQEAEPEIYHSEELGLIWPVKLLRCCPRLTACLTHAILKGEGRLHVGDILD